MKQFPARTPVVVLVLCALLLPARFLQADASAELRKELLAATVRAIELEIESTRGKLKTA